MLCQNYLILTLFLKGISSQNFNLTELEFLFPTTTDWTVEATDDPVVIQSVHNETATGPAESLLNLNGPQNLVGIDQNVVQVDLVSSELDKWEAPIEIQKSFQYYHAGFDEDGRPIWIAEVGHWNFRKVTDEGGELLKNFHKYCDQANRRILQSTNERNTEENPVTEVKFLIDLEDFNLIQMTHLPTVSLILEMLAKFRAILNDHMNLAMVVNTNAAAHGLITLIKPILGNIVQRIQVHGTQKNNWIPHVLRQFPKSSLPIWYGGVKDFKPLKVYG